MNDLIRQFIHSSKLANANVCSRKTLGNRNFFKEDTM